ncbi:MAG: YgjV family protein [Clostridia bacterium]|nr:YgjV family protein [Clostridia bacterium]
MLSYSVDAFAEALGVFYYVLVYGVGILAMLFSVAAFQFRHRITIILFNFLGQTTWVAYFLLQGDVTSAIACALSALMLAVFSRKGKWRWVASPVTVVAFVLLLSGFSLLSFKAWSDVFPLLAGAFAVIANSQTKEKRLRQFSVIWCLSWLFNSIFKFYPVAFFNDLFCTVSTVVALVRYREKRSDETSDR